MRALPAIAAARCGVFTSPEAAGDGWSRSALEHASRRGRLLHLQRGVWSDATDLARLPRGEAADLLLVRQSIAAAISVRGGIVSHLAAARLHELPIWAREPRPCVTVTRRERGVVDRVHTHRSPVTAGHVLAGTVFTTVERTIVDVTREFGVEAGLVVADAALHTNRVHLPDLVAEIADKPPAPGGRRLHQLLDLVDHRAESPLESRSRWHLHAHGVSAPRSQVNLRTSGGRFLGRVDFFWEEGVVGEVDGTVKYRRGRRLADDDPDDAHGREKWRQELMERTGLLFVRWGHRDFADFAPIAALVADRRARVQLPGWPRDWIAEPAR